MEFNLQHIKYMPSVHVVGLSQPQLLYPHNGNMNSVVMEQLEELTKELFLKSWHSVDAWYP